MVALKLRPTVDVEKTQTLNEGGISSGNLFRFKSGLPQKLGGWDRFYPGQVSGTPRALWGWADLEGTNHLGSGTTSQLAMITDGVFKDITPQQITTNPTPNFSTVINTPTVTVVDNGVTNVTTLDTVFFNTPVSVGGIILSGMYPIDVILGAHSYQITAKSNATATVNNGGVVPIFDTTIGEATVEVTLPDHAQVLDNIVVFQIPTSVGGLTINGSYKVSAVNSADIFSISGPTHATSTDTVTMNSGNAQLVYYINLGPPAIGVGYGVGPYGDGGYGLGTVPPEQVGIPITTLNWSEDNWGEILIACPFGGTIYYYPPTGSVSAQGHVPGGFDIAANVASAPVFNGGCFIAMPAQILVAWASSTVEDIGVLQDPLLVRWSDQLDFTNWVDSSTTQAGAFHIPTGSKIMGGLQAIQQALIWTDIDLYSMSYVGQPLVFAFNKIGSGCGLIGQHATTQLRGGVFWMGSGDFYVLGGGGVQSLPCTVWDFVFQDLDMDNAYKSVAGANSLFNEVRFDFPSVSGGTGENDKYVKYNVTEGSWDYGYNTTSVSAARSAWIDQSVLGQPIGAAPDTRLIYQHEISKNMDGAAMPYFWETGYFVISEGQSLNFVDWFFPDMIWREQGEPITTSATVLVTITATDYPNGVENVFGPFTMNSAQTYINCRLRGRQVKIKFSGADLDSFTRLGNMRLRSTADGRR